MEQYRYEQQIRTKADKAHEAAQRSGLPTDYIVAAELYEKAGEYEQARLCYEAAERLPKS